MFHFKAKNYEKFKVVFNVGISFRIYMVFKSKLLYPQKQFIRDGDFRNRILLPKV